MAKLVFTADLVDLYETTRLENIRLRDKCLAMMAEAERAGKQGLALWNDNEGLRASNEILAASADPEALKGKWIPYDTYRKLEDRVQQMEDKLKDANKRFDDMNAVRLEQVEEYYRKGYEAGRKKE